MSKMKPLVEAGSREQRSVTLDKIEFRVDNDDDGILRFSGHAAVFDQWTEIATPFGASFKENLARGAFRKVLAAAADVRFLGLNHNPDLVMARTAPGTMRLKEDAKGLRVDADLDPRDPDVQSLQVKLERGDVSQMSFGFAVGKHEIEEDEETGEIRRTITEFSALYDVSPVTFPAYEGTDAGLRAAFTELRSHVSRSKDLADAIEATGSVQLKNYLADVLAGQRDDSEPAESGLTVARANLMLVELG